LCQKSVKVFKSSNNYLKQTNYYSCSLNIDWLNKFCSFQIFAKHQGVKLKYKEEMLNFIELHR